LRRWNGTGDTTYVAPEKKNVRAEIYVGGLWWFVSKDYLAIVSDGAGWFMQDLILWKLARVLSLTGQGFWRDIAGLQSYGQNCQTNRECFQTTTACCMGI